MRAVLGLIIVFSLVFFIPQAVQQDPGSDISIRGVEDINSTEAKLKGKIESLGEFDNVSLRFRFREKDSGKKPAAFIQDIGYPADMEFINGTLYFDNGTYFVAYDVVTEKQKWNYTAGSSGISSLEVGDDLIYLGLDDKIHVYDPETDTNVWNYSTGEYGTDILHYRDGVIYSTYEAGSYTHEIFALNVSTQNRIWTHETDEFLRDVDIKDEMVYYTMQTYEEVAAYNISNGIKEWQFTTEGGSAWPIKARNNRLYYSAWNLEARNADNQNLIWKNFRNTEGSPGEFIFFNNSMYLETSCCPTSDTKDIRIVDSADGSVISHFNTTKDQQIESLAAGYDTLYAGGDRLEAYDDWRRTEVAELYVSSAPKNYSLNLDGLVSDKEYEIQAYVQGKNAEGLFMTDNSSKISFQTKNLSLPGDGSPSNPYLLSKCEHLKKMDDDRGANYKLSKDLDCSGTRTWNGGKGFDPVGSKYPDTELGFRGVLDGNGHYITDFYIDRPSESGLGIFDTLNKQAKVYDLHMRNVTISGDGSSGSVAGGMYGEAEISRVTADANITIQSYNGAAVVGEMGDQAKIHKSFAKGNITGMPDAGYTGGLVGSSWDTGVVINRSYSFANVSAGRSAVGGLVSAFDGEIYDSYSTGFVKAEGTWGEGGLIGSAGTVVDSYWDMNTSNYTTSDAGTNLTTEEMTGLDAPTYMSGFDFNDDWDVVQNHIFRVRDYPALKWQNIGNGSVSDPYKISDCKELQAMENDLQAYYVLARDINCSDTSTWNSGSGFDPVGSESTPFEGGFDGNGSKIYSLYIDRSSDQVGLFGHLSGSDVQNLSVIDADITGGSDTGIIAGSLDAGSEVNTSFVNGSVSGNENVGGVVGDLETSEIKSSYSLAEVSGSNYAGGLLGLNNLSLVNRSYSDGNSSGSNNGGLIGLDDGGNVAESYWDEEAGADNSDGGSGLNTTDMQGCGAANQMTGFDFVNIWSPEDSDYPSFKWSKMNAANCSVMNWTSQGDVDGFKLYDNSTGTFGEIADIPKSALASDVIKGWMNRPSSGYICYHVTAYLNVYPDTKLESSPSNEVCKSW